MECTVILELNEPNKSVCVFEKIGNLRTTTKFTTTTSVDWEKTATRTSVSAGKENLRCSRSVVDDHDTKCKHRCKTVMFVRNIQSFSQWRLLKQCKI